MLSYKFLSVKRLKYIILNSFIVFLMSVNAYSANLEPIGKNPPNNLKNIISLIKKSNLSVSNKYDFGPEPTTFWYMYKSIDEVAKIKKEIVDDNQTWQKIYKENSEESNYFCDNFYSDLLNLKNIEIHNPIIYHEQYDNEKLKEMLGDCYYNEKFKNFKYFNDYSNIIKLDRADSYSLYDEINFTGYPQNNLLVLLQHKILDNKHFDYLYVIDKNGCLKDTETISKHGDLFRYTDNSFDDTYFGIIRYKEKDYILAINELADPKNFRSFEVMIRECIPAG